MCPTVLSHCHVFVMASRDCYSIPVLLVVVSKVQLLSKWYSRKFGCSLEPHHLSNYSYHVLRHNRGIIVIQARKIVHLYKLSGLNGRKSGICTRLAVPIAIRQALFVKKSRVADMRRSINKPIWLQSSRVQDWFFVDMHLQELHVQPV